MERGFAMKAKQQKWVRTIGLAVAITMTAGVGVPTALDATAAPAASISASRVPASRLATSRLATARTFTVRGAPRVHGAMQVGSTVEVVGRNGVFSPTPTSFRYQWFRGNWAIPGATNRTYTLREADAGREISVRVTAVRSGVTNRHVRSAAREVWLSPAVIARQVLEFTNEERARYNLPALSLEATLAEAARLHSEDMIVNNYFSHTGLDGSTPWGRAAALGFDILGNFGENIAANRYSADVARRLVTQWMNSEGHRANILNEGFRQLGVGIHISNDGRVMATQKFAG